MEELLTLSLAFPVFGSQEMVEFSIVLGFIYLFSLTLEIPFFFGLWGFFLLFRASSHWRLDSHDVTSSATLLLLSK